jgi:hypothetical protein
MMSKCDHQVWVDGYWEDHPELDAMDEEEGVYSNHSEWIDGYHQSTFVDVDLHRMRCTQCGEISYYSSRAREHFEEGKSFPDIRGLE